MAVQSAPTARRDGRLRPEIGGRARQAHGSALFQERHQPHSHGIGYGVFRNQIKALTAVARRRRLPVHMDGARFANAVARGRAVRPHITLARGLTCSVWPHQEWNAGEALSVFFNRDRGEFAWQQAGLPTGQQMRFLTAPWVGLLKDGAWLHAAHANKMAQRLRRALRKIPA